VTNAKPEAAIAYQCVYTARRLLHFVLQHDDGIDGDGGNEEQQEQQRYRRRNIRGTGGNSDYGFHLGLGK
jgi:hypothetical protein